MKKLLCLFAVMLLCLGFGPATAEAADVKTENLPIIGAIIGVVEIAYSTVKNISECSGAGDCLNLPKSGGKGIINGIGRILGTTVNLVAPNFYKREFAKNSKLADNKIASNIVGWGALGYIGASLGMAGNGIFSIDQAHNALMVTGAIVGAGTAAIDIAADDGALSDE